MKIALIGLLQTGKKTVFSLMTGIGLDHLQGRAAEFHVGNVKVAEGSDQPRDNSARIGYIYRVNVGNRIRKHVR